ncbi:MAG: hypothetical protein NTV31_07955 [Bacteroidia bacterium]|nr:hypothetical protein [Bacteroidia bacterium]
MKKIIIMVWILQCTGTVFGQGTVDYILKARALTESGKPDIAINLLTVAIAGTKESRLYTERAEANILKGEYSDAINDYNEANKITPFSGEYGLSRIYALKGDAATSLYHLEMNLNSSFRKGEKEIMLDPAFGVIENRSEWRQFWKKEWYRRSGTVLLKEVFRKLNIISLPERSMNLKKFFLSLKKVIKAMMTFFMQKH